MQNGPALCIGCTWVLVQAWVHALSVDAGLFNRAVTVSSTSNESAPFQRIAFITNGTPAPGFMVLRVALCMGCTWVLDQARVDTVAIVAGLVQRAVIGALASN